MSAMKGIFKNLSVRQRLFRLVMLTSALAVAIVAVAVLVYEAGSYRPRALRELQNSSHLLRQVLPAALDFNDQEGAAQYLRANAEATHPALVIAAVYDRRGQLFASHATPQRTERVPRTPVPPGEVVTARELSLCLQLNRGQEVLGHLYLVQVLPPLHARLPQYAIMAGAVLLTLTIVGLTLMLGVRRSFLAPLSALLETTQTVARSNDYRVRAAVRRSDEIGQLATAFNQMLETIEQRDTALREAGNRLRTIFDATTEVLIVATDLEGTVTVFNTGAERILGYTAEQVVGKATPLLWHKSEEIAARATELSARFGVAVQGFPALTELARRGLQDRSEWTLVRCDGKELQSVLYITAVHGAEGALTGFLGVGSDISQRKREQAERERLQTQLIQAQKMEAVGQLAGGVAHDFNNILAAMMLHLDLLRSDHALSTEVQGAVSELQEYAKRASNLTRQLLLFSRRQVTQMSLIDLDSLLGNLLKMLRRLIGENISIEFRGAQQATWIVADSGMIEQVVMNLVVNARDAIRSGGRITLSTSLVDVSEGAASEHPERRAGRFVRLGVTDSGCGMDTVTRRRIFEPFFTTKEAGKGTGLGLATVYGIVVRHEGWLEVESEPGKGSTFSVYLPAAKGVESRFVPEASQPSILGGQETILLVEDDEAVRKLALTVLRTAGYRMLVASNGQEALNVWATHRDEIRLLLTDMIMPEGLTGLELARKLQGQRPDLKIAIMSGYSLELAEGVFTNDRVAYFAKPFEASALRRFVRQCLDGK